MANDYFDPKSGAVLPLATVQANPSAYLFYDPKSGAVVPFTTVQANPSAFVYFNPSGQTVPASTMIGGGGGPTLAALSLSTALVTGVVTNGTILGATNGSTLTLTAPVAGLAINGPARTFTFDGTASAGVTTNLRETLSGATNSPRDTPLTVGTGAITAPAAPSLTVTPGNAQNSLAWTDGSNGGAAITGHKLYAGPSAGSLTLLGTITTGSPYIDTGLTNGTARYYTISAVNSVGEGAQSSVQSGTPAAPAVQPLLFNADNIRMGTGSGNATATNTSWQGHTIHYVANECTELRFIFVNWYVNNSTGEVINNPDVPLTKASACNGTTAAPIMFSGSRSTTLTGSVAFTMSDPIYPAAFGLTTFPAGFALDVRCKGTLVATTGRLALAAFVAKYSNAAGVGFAQIYAPANDVDYVDTPGGMPAITGATVTFGTPLAAIVGRNVVAGKLAVIGDGHSAMYGVGDTQTADAWVSGHFGRAQHDANGAGPIIPMFNGGLSSATLKAWVSGHAYRSQFDQFANVAYMEFLSNDMSSRTIAQMTADMQTYISSKRGNGIKRVFTSDVLTRTLATSYSVTNLTVSGTTATATVASTANMTNGQQLDVSGASVSGFNGTKTITIIDGVTFTYQVASGLATPTGTIVAVDNWATAAGQGEVALYENNASSVRNTLNNTTLPSLTGPTMFDEVMTLRNIVQMGGVDHQYWNYNGTSKFQTADGIHSNSSVVGATPVSGHAAMGAYDRQRLLAYQAAGL